MSLQDARAFMQLVTNDETLQMSILRAVRAGRGIDATDTVLASGNDAGFEFTRDELLEVREEIAEGELSEDSLEAVAGGGYFETMSSMSRTSHDMIMGIINDMR